MGAFYRVIFGTCMFFLGVLWWVGGWLEVVRGIFGSLFAGVLGAIFGGCFLEHFAGIFLGAFHGVVIWGVISDPICLNCALLNIHQ